MTFQRKMMSLAVLAAGWAIVQPTEAQAKPKGGGKLAALARNRARQNEGDFSPDLGFGSIPLPLNPARVRLYDKNHRHQGVVPPPIPRAFNNPSNRLLNAIAFRQAFALELARERALARADNVYGGIFFQPPLGTPFTPVNNLNLFTYLPVFRAFGGG